MVPPSVSNCSPCILTVSPQNTQYQITPSPKIPKVQNTQNQHPQIQTTLPIKYLSLNNKVSNYSNLHNYWIDILIMMMNIVAACREILHAILITLHKMAATSSIYFAETHDLGI